MASVDSIQIEINTALVDECNRLRAENERIRMEIVGSLTEAGISMLAEGATSQGEIPSAVATLARERDLATRAWYEAIEARNAIHAAHQLEIESHRKTFRQLEQAKREIAQLKGEGL